jgi:hypothetical protein
VPGSRAGHLSIVLDSDEQDAAVRVGQGDDLLVVTLALSVSGSGCRLGRNGASGPPGTPFGLALEHNYLPSNTLGESPLVRPGAALFASQGSGFYLLDLATQEVRWRTKLPELVRMLLPRTFS